VFYEKLNNCCQILTARKEGEPQNRSKFKMHQKYQCVLDIYWSVYLSHVQNITLK
jgi:hypothetical protein